MKNGLHPLRTEPVCLNCGHEVLQRFCPNCGQENIETRQSFIHLAAHFLQDFFHYDSGFRKSIKYLLFRPGILTSTYLAGKRQVFVSPVRMYLFISFVCFFLPGTLPDFSKRTTENQVSDETKKQVELGGALSKTDTSRPFSTMVFWLGFKYQNQVWIFPRPHDYRSLQELDAAQRSLAPARRYNWLEYRMAKRIIYIYDHYSEEQISDRFVHSFSQNVSKMLFFYMPCFAFFLWLFHNKKRWYYYDHAIFTIRYFSLILLLISLMNIMYSILSISSDRVFDITTALYTLVTFVWMFLYFFIAHHRIYHDRNWLSVLKGLTLFVINIFAMIVVLIIFTNITLFTIQ